MQRAFELDEPEIVLFGLPDYWGKIYISYILFMDVDTKSVMEMDTTRAFNSALKEILRRLAAKDSRYVINAPGHTLPDNDETAAKVNQILLDNNLSRAEKVITIIKELMIPNSIDGLVAGQVKQYTDGSITVRPFVVSKRTKCIVTERLTFRKEDFNCPDPKDWSKKCPL